jgi:hypothetical protein
MKSTRRPQATKRTTDHQRYVTELRSSNAAMPHVSKNVYKRKPKHGKVWND